MGTWGPGPFDNAAAADFLARLSPTPSRGVAKALRAAARTPAGRHLDVDDGGAAWAACELVALAYGRGEESALEDAVGDLAAKLPPSEELRRLAIDALARLADPTTSELAALWHEGQDRGRFEASLRSLRGRLRAAGKGARVVRRPKAGDVIGLPAGASSRDVIVVQVVGHGEVAVTEGSHRGDAAALAAVKTRPARRVPAPVHGLLRRGRWLGNVPVPKDLDRNIHTLNIFLM